MTILILQHSGLKIPEFNIEFSFFHLVYKFYETLYSISTFIILNIQKGYKGEIFIKFTDILNNGRFGSVINFEISQY